MRFWSSMKAAVSARLADPARLSTTRREAAPLALAHDAARADRDFDRDIGAKALHGLVKRARQGWQTGQMFDQRFAATHCFATFHRLTIACDGPGREIAFAVGEGFIMLNREGVL